MLTNVGILSAFFLGWVVCMLSESYLAPADGFLARVVRYGLSAIHNPKTQWAVFVAAVMYFYVFLFFIRMRNSSSHWAWKCSDTWLAFGALGAILSYARNYTTASGSTAAVVLVIGLALSKAVGLWTTRPLASDIIKNKPAFPLYALVVFLSLASLWQPDLGISYGYRGVSRWVGGWSNPNTYGLLMATGIALTIGCSAAVLINKNHAALIPHLSSATTRATLLCLSLVAAVLMSRALLYSYSRGAWIAAVFGVWYVLFSTGIFSQKRKFYSVVRDNFSSICILLFSSLLICFYLFSHSDARLLRRLFSVGNINDFSWRNRITAWEGAMQMIADRPWFGFGWNRAEAMYNSFYRPVRLEEGMAINMNSYLVLGVTVGIPTLICFMLAIWMAIKGRASGYGQTVRSTEIIAPSFEPLRTASRAGVIVLLIGFWFDGGLFTLELTTPFWVLLELGRTDRTA